MLLVATQSCVNPQLDEAQDAPTVGIAPHVPQLLVLLSLQKELAHCPENAQGAAAARGPTVTQAVGGLSSRKSAHDSPASAATQFSTRTGLLPVEGAARPIVQESFSRARHVDMSPHVLVMPAPLVHVMRLPHRAWARSVHASSAVVPTLPQEVTGTPTRTQASRSLARFVI
jgi:hypothetical protein